MRQIFYQTKNISGMILVLSPLLGSAAAHWPFFFYLILLAGAACALPLSCAALQHLPFRIWRRLSALSACLALLLLSLSVSRPLQNPAILWSGAFLLGISCSRLLLLFPPLVAVGWYRRSPAAALGILWSGSFLLLPFWRFLLHTAPGFFFCAASVCLLTGLFGFLRQPPVDCRRLENPMTQGRTGIFARPSLFTGAISASLGMGLAMVLRADQTDSPMAGRILSPAFPLIFCLALAAGSLFTARFIERKGIFSGCILLLFLCESATACLGNPDRPLLSAAGLYLLAGAAGSVPVILPVLTLYLYGIIAYPQNLCRLLFFFPAGLLCALPFCYLALEGQLAAEEPAVFLLFLLVGSFFCIFSAWKHRFIILKNRIL